jgi:hypothetical protein
MLSVLFGLAGMGGMLAGAVILFGHILFLLTVTTATLGLALRSRIATVAALPFMVLLVSMTIAFCSAKADPDERDWEVVEVKEMGPKIGTLWACGLAVLVPLEIIAAVRAFREPPGVS